jgi:hypothetical protein
MQHLQFWLPPTLFFFVFYITALKLKLFKTYCNKFQSSIQIPFARKFYLSWYKSYCKWRFRECRKIKQLSAGISFELNKQKADKKTNYKHGVQNRPT